MCSAWATMRPPASNSAAEQSRRSLMLEEYAPWMSSAPASSAMLASALERTDRVTGSSRSLIGSPRALSSQHQRAGIVDGPAPARSHDARGLRELDHRRSGHLEAGAERGPLEAVDLDPLAVEVRPSAAGLGGPVGRALAQRRLGHRHRSGEPQVDELDGLAVDAVPVALLVRLGEALRQRPQIVGVDGQLVGLQPVPPVGPPLEARRLQGPAGGVLELGESSLERLLRGVVERYEPGGDVVPAQVR